MPQQHKTLRSLFADFGTDDALRTTFVKNVADAFQRELASVLNDRELVAIDYCNAVTMESDDSCASHEFLDANEQMNDAINAVIADHVSADDEAGEFLDLMQSDFANQASSVWGDAWSLASERGFSELWSRRGDIVEADLHVLAFVLMARPDRFHERYGPMDIRIANAHFPPLPEFVSDQEAIDKASESFVYSLYEIETGELGELAAEVRESFEAQDEGRLLAGLALRVSVPQRAT
jgi:FAD/FMN-containing dehydrogenase